MMKLEKWDKVNLKSTTKTAGTINSKTILFTPIVVIKIIWETDCVDFAKQLYLRGWKQTAMMTQKWICEEIKFSNSFYYKYFEMKAAGASF